MYGLVLVWFGFKIELGFNLGLDGLGNPSILDSVSVCELLVWALFVFGFTIYQALVWVLILLILVFDWVHKRAGLFLGLGLRGLSFVFVMTYCWVVLPFGLGLIVVWFGFGFGLFFNFR